MHLTGSRQKYKVDRYILQMITTVIAADHLIELNVETNRCDRNSIAEEEDKWGQVLVGVSGARLFKM
jgi:hypothetical protein